MGSPTGLAQLEQAWNFADKLFTEKITVSKSMLRPISLRHPFIFYLAHLPSFTWSTLSRLYSLPPVHPQFDKVFTRGIDPNVTNPEQCHDHPETPEEWPTWDMLETYKEEVRGRVKEVAKQLDIERELRLFAEHDLMHCETLHYMEAQSKRPSTACNPCAHPVSAESVTPAKVEWVPVKANTVRLGAPAKADSFAWDNELNSAEAHVDEFEIGKHAVTIGNWLRFIKAGGYSKSSLWTPQDWEWVSENGILHPKSWACLPEGYIVLVGEGLKDVDLVLDWPVSVSLAEVRAYCKWVGNGARPITEAEWLLSCFGRSGCGDGDEDMGMGKIALQGEPVSVEQGVESWTGVVGMVGNGWEVTGTVFESFDGFVETKEYKQYSKDFFDGEHYVLRGASWKSAYVRKGFRNFYQDKYGFVFSKFRMARSV